MFAWLSLKPSVVVSAARAIATALSPLASATALSAAAAQLADAQRELAAAKSETAQINSSLQAIERDRTNRIAQLQQENAAITARLRQAQGTLDQIAAAARLMNGSVPLPPAASPALRTASSRTAKGLPELQSQARSMSFTTFSPVSMLP